MAPSLWRFFKLSGRKKAELPTGTFMVESSSTLSCPGAEAPDATIETEPAPREASRPAFDAQAGADTDADTGRELGELKFRYREVDVDAKSNGTLNPRLSEPESYTSHIQARVFWNGRYDDFDEAWEHRIKGFVTASHASFNLYRRKKFINRSGRYWLALDDEEGYVFFDIESDSGYENENPGTVTIEGFGF
ncbi:hypothetical protein BDV12DRAFT_195660 [Aspergillus spectabilis]